MSNIHDGPLATYNSLTDRNLAGYFGNTRMRRHLRKAGLINRRGEIVSENQYRVNMARKEHKKHVKELLAQAIVHKTLDLERYRQVEIKRKLEEIAKIELVRRVRSEERGNTNDIVYRDGKASRGRKGDEEVLPYLTPRSMSRPQSERPSESSSVPRRPKSAPAPPRNRPSSSRGFVDPYEDVIYVDDDGRPVSPPPSDRASSKDLRTEGIDTRHLYALDSEALQQYALKLSRSERGRDGATSPYLISQFPVPPKSERAKSARSPRRSARMSARPEGPAKERRAGVRQSDQIPHSARKDPDTVEGALMLHRQEPAMMHQGEVQTLCEIQMKYHGPNLTLPRDQHDPTQEVAIEQQHCGGNTLPVFRERLQPGKTFSFISRRHRGYPFSLTLYIDGRVDCRISTCCEYKHGVGVRLGGKMGHFSLTGISGATPCYKCKLSCQAPPRSLKLKKSTIKKKKERSPEPQEEVTVDNTPRSPVVPSKQEPEVNGKSDDEESYSSEHKVVISVEEDGDQSKTEMSVQRKYSNRDKFVPQNPKEARSGLTPLESSLTVKESKVEVETNSDLGEENESEYKDDFEDDKNPQSEALNENSLKENTNKFDDNNSIAINGYEHTEIATEKDSMNDTENDKTKKPIDYQDTDYEIEEDIFNEQSEVLKDVESQKDEEGSKATGNWSGPNDDKNHRETDDITITETVAEEINTEIEDLNVGLKATSNDEFLLEDIQAQSGKETDQNTLKEDGQFVSSICRTAVNGIQDGQSEGRDDNEEIKETPEKSEKNNSRFKGVRNDNKKDNYEDDFEDEDTKHEDDSHDDGQNGDKSKSRSE